jgi:hypothetical protein
MLCRSYSAAMAIKLFIVWVMRTKMPEALMSTTPSNDDNIRLPFMIGRA